jgi:predicted secreted protein
MKLLKILCLVLLFSLSARATDVASVEVIGFSKDGRFVVFEQYGTQYSGFTYAIVTVVDTAKNLLVRQVSRKIENSEAKVSQARAAVGRSAVIRPYGIVVGNRGRLFNLSPRPTDGSPQRSQFVHGGRTHQLELLSQFVDVDEKICPDRIQSRLELKLTVAGKTRSMQKDGKLPSSRACARAYEMKSAHVFGNILAVFVTVDLLGFEGSDLRWMVITTKL